jgi:hypothetical protein
MSRRQGRDADARRVPLEKHRRHRATLRAPARLLGLVLDALAGYGYRAWLAGVWIIVFWALGALTFALEPSRPREASDAASRNAVLQSLDLLLPIVDLGYDGAWQAVGASQYVAAALVLMGWVLTTAVVAGLSRTLSR